MKYSNDFKVEYKSEELTIKSNNRCLKYRIVPSQLSFWQRLFCNEWHYVYKDVYTWKTRDCANSVDDLLNMIFSYKEARTFVEEHQTLGEVVKHQNDVILHAKQHFDSFYGVKDVWDF